MNEQKDFLNRLLDLAGQAEKKGRETATTFLSPAEQAAAEPFLRKRGIPFSMSGGFPAAERARCLFWTDADQPADPADHLAVTAITAAQAGLQHRDYLGALLGLGLRREEIGDILVKADKAFIIHHPRLASLLQTQLTQVGSLTVRCQAAELADLSNESQTEPETAVVSVSSLRADVVLVAAFHFSRNDSLEFFRRGLVQVDWSPCEKPDQQLKIGQTLSLRGTGRVRLISSEGLSRKGKIRLVIEKT